MNTDNSISEVLRNAIYAISERYVFDVEDMILCILKDFAQHPKCVKVYAPWIQKVVDHAMKTEYLAKKSQKLHSSCSQYRASHGRYFFR
jgi:hypothetical protein